MRQYASAIDENAFHTLLYTSVNQNNHVQVNDLVLERSMCNFIWVEGRCWRRQHVIHNFILATIHYPMLYENEVIFKCVRQNVASAIDEARVSHFAVHFRKYRISHVNEIVFECVRQNVASTIDKARVSHFAVQLRKSKLSCSSK